MCWICFTGMRELIPVPSKYHLGMSNGSIVRDSHRSQTSLPDSPCARTPNRLHRRNRPRSPTPPFQTHQDYRVRSDGGIPPSRRHGGYVTSHHDDTMMDGGMRHVQGRAAATRWNSNAVEDRVQQRYHEEPQNFHIRDFSINGQVACHSRVRLANASDNRDRNARIEMGHGSQNGEMRIHAYAQSTGASDQENQFKLNEQKDKYRYQDRKGNVGSEHYPITSENKSQKVQQDCQKETKDAWSAQLMRHYPKNQLLKRIWSKKIDHNRGIQKDGVVKGTNHIPGWVLNQGNQSLRSKQTEPICHQKTKSHPESDPTTQVCCPF